MFPSPGIGVPKPTSIVSIFRSVSRFCPTFTEIILFCFSHELLLSGGIFDTLLGYRFQQLIIAKYARRIILFSYRRFKKKKKTFRVISYNIIIAIDMYS